MRIILAFVLLCACGAQATAQAPKNREEYMQKVLQIALQNIQNARCGSERCSPATEAEKKNPPLSLSETSEVVGRGIFSGGAAYCGLDWQKRNFVPMMDYWKKQKKKNDRQLAMIAIIHNVMIEQIQANFAAKGACPEEMRKDVDSKLNFKPQG